MSYTPEQSSNSAIVQRGEVEFGIRILGEMANYHHATPEEKQTYGFGFIAGNRIADVVLPDAIPSYERLVQEKSGIFLLEHSEVNLRPIQEREAA